MTKSIPQKIGCLILDMDGVLVDTEPLHIEAFARYMDELGIAYRREYIHGFVGYSIEDNVRRINRELLPGREVDVAEGVRQRDRIYLDLLRSASLQPMPGIRELVAFCREKGWQVALASSSSREQVDLILDNLARNGFPAARQLDAVVCGDDVANRKPHGDIYRQMLKRLNCEPDRAMAVEDSGAGVTSAKAAGIFCVAVRSPFVPDEQLAQADWVVDSVAQLAALLKEQA